MGEQVAAIFQQPQDTSCVRAAAGWPACAAGVARQRSISDRCGGVQLQSASLLTFQSGTAGVTDVAWSPHSATVFGCVTAAGAPMNAQAA